MTNELDGHDKDAVRVANCSGFYGDRPSAALEMVTGGEIDFLTGDWLAELTMLILARTQAKRSGGGYARTFVDQMEQVLGSCQDKAIRVVSNAGGLDPSGCAERVADIANRLGVSPQIAYVTGDNLLPRIGDLAESGDLEPFEEGTDLGDLDSFITANAYLGCWGIVEALQAGADVVITGRVTDAAVVAGPAAWHHGWERDDLDQMAGAVVAGHVIECGTQATGGNYSFFTDIDGRTEVGGRARFGFPWADIAADGSSVIGKHAGTGGMVSVGTVTSQLLYEIGGPEYLGPDVTARFDTVSVTSAGPDRVAIGPVRGQAPPAKLKVAMNEVGGFRNSAATALTGLDIEEKAAFAEAAFWDACPYDPDDFDFVKTTLARTDTEDPTTQEQATAVLRVFVKDADEVKVGRAFSDAMVNTALASVPGFYGVGGVASRAGPYGVYRPALVSGDVVPQLVHLPGRDPMVVESNPPEGVRLEIEPVSTPDAPGGPTETAAAGAVLGARSGDKGGHANLGLFALGPLGWAWLDNHFSVERISELLPEVAELRIDRHRFPNLRALNFLIHDFLEDGVASSTRQDPQAKALGEWFRARAVEIPTAVLTEASEARP